MTALHLRHRTASGSTDALWEFDPARRAIDVVAHQGNTTLELTLPLCSKDRPRFGAHPIVSVNGESWRVLAARWATHPTGHFVDAPIHESLGMSAIVLTNAPADVDAELAAL